MTTVQEILDQVAYDLLQDPPRAFSLDVVPVEQVLDLLGTVLMDFLRETGMVRSIYTQQAIAGQTKYTYPDSITEVYTAFWDAKILDRVDLYSDDFLGEWAAKRGIPIRYHEDGLPTNTIEVTPPPSTSGATTAPVFDTFQPRNRNITVIGSTLASQETWDANGILDSIPDSFTPYLVFGILKRIFSADSEEKDNQRSQYCQARWEEGVLLGRSILKQYTGGDQNAA